MATWHVTPQNDVLKHSTENDDCHCKPKREILENGDLLIVHNSYDGRENLELDNDRHKN